MFHWGTLGAAKANGLAFIAEIQTSQNTGRHRWVWMKMSYPEMEVSINGGTPKWMVYKGKSHYINNSKLDYLGVPLF